MISVPNNLSTEINDRQEVTASPEEQQTAQKAVPIEVNRCVMQQERNDYILESLRQAEFLMRDIARRYASDYDDLYQVAAEIVLKYYDRAQQMTNPRAYLHRAIRNAIFQYVGIAGTHKQTLADHYRIRSLDAPLRSDSTRSLYSLIGHTVPHVEGDARDYSCLYAILDALPSTSREVLCMRFGLCGYGVHRNCDIARLLGISQEAAKTRFQYAKTMLRQHIELLNLVGCQA